MMSEKNNTKCDICGKEYYVCQSCSEVTKFKPWRTVTDTFDHYMVFLALSNYHHNGNVEEARKALSSCDLTDYESYNENIKSVIDEIMKDKQEAAIDNEDAVKIKPVVRKTKRENNIEQ